MKHPVMHVEKTIEWLRPDCWYRLEELIDALIAFYEDTDENYGCTEVLIEADGTIRLNGYRRAQEDEIALSQRDLLVKE